jgi:hypothetical protein
MAPDWIVETMLKRSSVSRSLTRIFLVLALAGLAGCGAGPTAIAPAPPSAVPSPTEVAGAWSGTTRAIPCDVLASAGRCNAVNNITITLNQSGSQLTGKYTCATGNMICRHGGADDSGDIDSGSISGNQFNLSVIIPADVSNCYYHGATTSATEANGVYMCYQGGMQVEQGVWNLSRAAAE